MTKPPGTHHREWVAPISVTAGETAFYLDRLRGLPRRKTKRESKSESDLRAHGDRAEGFPYDPQFLSVNT